jgi:hypothetical protein
MLFPDFRPAANAAALASKPAAEPPADDKPADAQPSSWIDRVKGILTERLW